MRLVVKITFLSLIATFLSMALFVLASANKTSTALKDILSKELVSDAVIYSHETDHLLEMRLEDALDMAESTVLEADDSEVISSFLKNLISAFSWADNIIFLDSRGKYVADSSSAGKHDKQLKFNIMQSRKKLFEAIKSGKQQIVYFYRESNHLNPDFIILTPVYNKDRPGVPSGFLALDVSMEKALEEATFLYHDMQPERRVYVIDFNDVVLMSPSGAETGKNVFNDISKKPWSDETNPTASYTSYASAETGEERLVAYSRVKDLFDLYGVTWRVVITTPSSVTAEQTQSLANAQIMLGTAVTILAVLLAYLLGSSITGPLKRIVEMAEALEDGDYSKRIPIEKVSVEFEALSRTLNHMAEQVSSRTEKMSDANDKLLEEIERHKQTQAALISEEERFRLMVENLPVGAVYVEKGKVFLNRAAETISGYSRNSIQTTDDLNKAFAESSNADLSGHFEGIRISEFKKTINLKLTRKDGTIRDVELSGYQFEKGIVWMVRDVTDQLSAEMEKEAIQQQLYQAQKMEAIGQLAGGMAHDFNNMIGVIIGSAGIAMMDIHENDPGYKELKNIVEASRRAKELSTKILTFARKEVVTVASSSVKEILDDSISMFKRAMPHEVTLTTNIPDNLPRIMVDAFQIEQVLINLFGNACDAMPGGGSIHVEAFPCERKVKTNGVSEMKKFCAVKVSDTGHGMPKDVADRIFEPFFTTKKAGKGTGLGLSVTMGIIRNHGGIIEVKSEPEKGTAISILLPIDENAPAEAPAVAAAPAATRKSATGEADAPLPDACATCVKKKEKILVIDDEQMMREVAVSILQRDGFRVISASSGEEGLEIFEKRKDEIILVALDIMMRGIDGIETLKKIREIEPGIKAIFASGHAEEETIQSRMPEMLGCLVRKPYENEELTGLVRTTIGK